MCKKNSIICVIFFFVTLLIVSTPVFAKNAGLYSFVKKLLPLNSKTLRKMSDEIPTGMIIKKTDIATIRKSLPDIDIKRFDPDVLKLATIGGKIAKTSKFADNLINKAPNPADIISQYSKYGKPYLETAQKFSKTVVSHAASLIKISPQKLKKLGNLPKETIIKFKDVEFANSAFVSVVKRTGKTGYDTIKKINQLVLKYPKSSIAAGLLIWFSTDPESFLDSVTDVGEFASSFATQTTTALAEGAGKGIIENLTTDWNDPTKQKYLLFGGIFLIAIMMLSLRIFRRLILFPFSILGSSLNTFMDKKEANIGNLKPLNKVKKEKNNRKKVLSASSPATAQNNETKGLF